MSLAWKIFDSTITAGSFITVGDFFGCFQQEMLSVFAAHHFQF